MITSKNIGIWMDHSNAHLMDFSNNEIESRNLSSAFTRDEKEFSLSKSEKGMHNKEQHQQAEYYKNIGDIIKNYSNVLLFGGTTAKTELSNVLKEDARFAKINIEVKHTDKMTENQQHAFVKDYFSKL